MSIPKCLTKVSHNGLDASLLSWTSDMNAWSFSLPAGKEGSCIMAVYGDDSVCGSCYAQINRYNMPNVLKAQWVRFLWTKNLMRDSVGREEFIVTMIGAIKKYAVNGWFRGHDSGDFFSPDYVDCWAQICFALPNVKFWFPTRCWPHKGTMGPKWVAALKELASLRNVTVRPSALKFDEAPPKVPFLSKGTGVGFNIKDVVFCPKTLNGGTCQTNHCRSCWSDEVEIFYKIHGYLGRNIPANARSDKIIETRNKIATLTIRGEEWK